MLCVQIYHLVRALAARPNVCGYNAYHTYGGVLLRPHSCKADSDLPPLDVWVWNEVSDSRLCASLLTAHCLMYTPISRAAQIGAAGTTLTGNPVHSCYEDFTFDKKDLMSGASDDFMYDHCGVYSWTTEFWDPIYAATGHRASTKVWYLGPTVEESLALAAWADVNAPDLYVAWREVQHPQLGTVELGGPNEFKLVTNPPPHLIKKEVAPHADFAIYQVRGVYVMCVSVCIVVMRSDFSGHAVSEARNSHVQMRVCGIEPERDNLENISG